MVPNCAKCARMLATDMLVGTFVMRSILPLPSDLLGAPPPALAVLLGDEGGVVRSAMSFGASASSGCDSGCLSGLVYGGWCTATAGGSSGVLLLLLEEAALPRRYTAPSSFMSLPLSEERHA